MHASWLSSPISLSLLKTVFCEWPVRFTHQKVQVLALVLRVHLIISFIWSWSTGLFAHIEPVKVCLYIRTIRPSRKLEVRRRRSWGCSEEVAKGHRNFFSSAAFLTSKCVSNIYAFDSKNDFLESSETDMKGVYVCMCNINDETLGPRKHWWIELPAMLFLACLRFN